MMKSTTNLVLRSMRISGDSVEVYFNESDPFEVEASGVASCYDKIILQVKIYLKMVPK